MDLLGKGLLGTLKGQKISAIKYYWFPCSTAPQNNEQLLEVKWSEVNLKTFRFLFDVQLLFMNLHCNCSLLTGSLFTAEFPLTGSLSSHH